MDVLTAIRWAYEEWRMCPPQVIKSCFDHCFKKTGGIFGTVTDNASQNILQRIEQNAQDNMVSYIRAGLQNLLNPEDENVATEQISVEQLERFIAVDSETADEKEMSEISDNDDEEHIDRERREAATVFRCCKICARASWTTYRLSY